MKGFSIIGDILGDTIMREIIDSIINELPLRFHNLNFDSLVKDSEWNCLPTMVKLVYLDRYLLNYNLNDQKKIVNYLTITQNQTGYNNQKKVAMRIISVINYFINSLPITEINAKHEYLNRIKEEMKKSKSSENKEGINYYVMRWLTNILPEMITIQNEHFFPDERELEDHSYKIYCLHKDLYDKNLAKLNEINASSNGVFDKQLIDLFIELYIDSPDLSRSTIEYWLPNTYQFFEQKFKSLLSDKRISLKELEEFEKKLYSKCIEFKEILAQQEHVLSYVDQKFFNTMSRVQMMQYYNKKLIFNINAFSKYLKLNYINNRSKVVFPSTFLETIIDTAKFDKVLNKLQNKGFLKMEENGTYSWQNTAPELILLLEKLNEIGLLKIPLKKGNYNTYGGLLCAYFNKKYSPRALQKSNITTNARPFSFLNYI